MTTNLKEYRNKHFADAKSLNNNLLIQKYEINPSDMPVICDDDINLTFDKKCLIIEKLLEAHVMARANILAGNITNRGFGANVCDNDNNWEIGVNFNNTRNDISSICAERSAIISLYNKAIHKFSLNPDSKFNFSVKYICMVQGIDLDKIQNSIVPCEDCLSWFNTNRYFDDDTIIFSFEKKDETLCLKASKLINLLPYRSKYTHNISLNNNKIRYSKKASLSMNKFNLQESNLLNLIKTAYSGYLKNDFSKISGQNISCSILADKNTYSASKIDWTKRWFFEPLEQALSKAIEDMGESIKIQAIAYFGDEYSKDNFKDGVVSIKSLGRARQKYVSSDTLLVLNLSDEILITTVGEYLPQKFIQGYKII